MLPKIKKKEKRINGSENWGANRTSTKIHDEHQKVFQDYPFHFPKNDL